MERVNFQVIEKKWQEHFASSKLYNRNGKNFIFDDFEKQIKIDEKKLFHF